MSELQTNLALLGAVLIGAIFAYSRFQELRHRRLAEKALPARTTDPLQEIISAPRHRDPPLGQLEGEPRVEAETLLRGCEPPNPELEFCVTLQREGGITATEFWQALTRSTMTPRGIRWAGRRGDGWYVIDGPGGQGFEQIAALLQLSSRAGPINEAKLSLFGDEVGHLAKGLGARLSSDDRASATQRAEQLERFCQDADILIGVNVVFPAERRPSGGRLAQLLSKEGLNLSDEDGLFHAPDEDGADRFVLMQRDSTPFLPVTLEQGSIAGVTFLLDVPRVVRTLDTLKEMFAMAQRMAVVLGGELVDDNGAALGERQFDLIQKQLADVLQTMSRKGIPPGGTAALRLFSH